METERPRRMVWSPWRWIHPWRRKSRWRWIHLHPIWCGTTPSCQGSHQRDTNTVIAEPPGPLRTPGTASAATCRGERPSRYHHAGLPAHGLSPLPSPSFPSPSASPSPSPPFLQKCHLFCTEPQALGKSALGFLWAAAAGDRRSPAKATLGVGCLQKAAKRCLKTKPGPAWRCTESSSRALETGTQTAVPLQKQKSSGLPGRSAGVQREVPSRCLGTSSSQDGATD